MKPSINTAHINDLTLQLAKLRREKNELDATIRFKEQELAEAEWILLTWNQLEKHLKENPKERVFDNPKVKRRLGDTSTTYCYIDKNGDLVIGPYYHNDRFPRGCDLYIRRDLKSYS